MEDFGSVEMNLFPQCVSFSKVVLLLNVNTMLTFGKLIFSTIKRGKDHNLGLQAFIQLTILKTTIFLLPKFFTGGQVKFIQLRSELPRTVKRKSTLR